MPESSRRADLDGLDGFIFRGVYRRRKAVQRGLGFARSYYPE
jgi:hypothetical protein